MGRLIAYRTLDFPSPLLRTYQPVNAPRWPRIQLCWYPQARIPSLRPKARRDGEFPWQQDSAYRQARTVTGVESKDLAQGPGAWEVGRVKGKDTWTPKRVDKPVSRAGEGIERENLQDCRTSLAH